MIPRVRRSLEVGVGKGRPPLRLAAALALLVTGIGVAAGRSPVVSDTLCKPCILNSDCHWGGLCVPDATRTSSFCTQDCTDSLCPEGFECIVDRTGTAHQCLPPGGSCSSSTVTSTTSPATTTPTASSTTTTRTTTTMLRFVDNGDGTVSDYQSGLIWEKKVAGSGCPHCVNDRYTWSASASAPDGTAFTRFLASVNGGATGVGNCASSDGSTAPGGFNRHCDWRLPTIAELATIIDTDAAGCGSGSACIDPIFGPTALSAYWSATTVAGVPAGVWVGDFAKGRPVAGGKNKGFVNFVRAVRGGW